MDLSRKISCAAKSYRDPFIRVTVPEAGPLLQGFKFKDSRNGQIILHIRWTLGFKQTSKFKNPTNMGSEKAGSTKGTRSDHPITSHISIWPCLSMCTELVSNPCLDGLSLCGTKCKTRVAVQYSEPCTQPCPHGIHGHLSNSASTNMTGDLRSKSPQRTATAKSRRPREAMRCERADMFEALWKLRHGKVRSSSLISFPKD